MEIETIACLRALVQVATMIGDSNGFHPAVAVDALAGAMGLESKMVIRDIFLVPNPHDENHKQGVESDAN
jgi:hypothetical protein